MISKSALYARKAREKKKRIQMLCDRLDRHVNAAEKLKSGETRAFHLRVAEEARQQLKILDH